MPSPLVAPRSTRALRPERVLDLHQAVLPAPPDESIGLATFERMNVEPAAAELEPALAQGGSVLIGVGSARHGLSRRLPSFDPPEVLSPLHGFTPVLLRPLQLSSHRDAHLISVALRPPSECAEYQHQDDQAPSSGKGQRALVHFVSARQQQNAAASANAQPHRPQQASTMMNQPIPMKPMRRSIRIVDRFTSQPPSGRYRIQDDRLTS